MSFYSLKVFQFVFQFCHFILSHLQLFTSFSMNSKAQMIERLKIKRGLSELNSFKIEFQKSLSSSFMRSWFKLLSNDLRSIVKTNCFEFAMHFLSFELFSKLKMFIKIKCKLFNDTIEEHIVREENKKLQAENYVFFSYEFEKKLSHLSEKYEEISNSIDIIFAIDLQTSKKRNVIVKQMTTNQKNASVKWNRQMRKWISKRLMWKYNIVIDFFANNISKINWSMTQNEMFKVIDELESETNDKIKHCILEITIQKLIREIIFDESAKKKENARRILSRNSFSIKTFQRKKQFWKSWSKQSTLSRQTSKNQFSNRKLSFSMKASLSIFSSYSITWFYRY